MTERRCGTCRWWGSSSGEGSAVNRVREKVCWGPEPDSMRYFERWEMAAKEGEECETWTPADRAARIALLRQQIAELEKESERQRKESERPWQPPKTWIQAMRDDVAEMDEDTDQY